MHNFKVGMKARVIDNECVRRGFAVGTIVEAVEVEPQDYNGVLVALWVSPSGEQAWLREDAVQPITEASAFDLLEVLLGTPLKFRSGCDVKFVAYVKDAKPHCQLVLLNPSTGNVVTRYANGKSSTETYEEPGDILVCP